MAQFRKRILFFDVILIMPQPYLQTFEFLLTSIWILTYKAYLQKIMLQPYFTYKPYSWFPNNVR